MEFYFKFLHKINKINKFRTRVFMKLDKEKNPLSFRLHDIITLHLYQCKIL